MENMQTFPYIPLGRQRQLTWESVSKRTGHLAIKTEGYRAFLGSWMEDVGVLRALLQQWEPGWGWEDSQAVIKPIASEVQWPHLSGRHCQEPRQTWPGTYRRDQWASRGQYRIEGPLPHHHKLLPHHTQLHWAGGASKFYLCPSHSLTHLSRKCRSRRSLHHHIIWH